MLEKLTALEKFSLELQAALAEVQHPPQEMLKRKNARNVANDHPMLKTLIHPLFFELCHVNKVLKKSDRIKLLCEVEPLELGKPYELCDQKQAWHPNWKGNVDDAVNTAYIQEIVTRLWDDEKVLCEKTGKGEIPDVDYDRGIITECAKSYFRNVHKQYLQLNDEEKARQAERRKTNSKHRAHRQTVTNARRKAVALASKTLESQAKGAMAMIDTDYASEQLSYVSDADLSDDTLQRRKDAGVGDGALMVEGSERRSIDKKKPIKRVFDLAPSKMNHDPPTSNKKNKLTVPFKSMVAEKWLKTHPNMELLEGGEWLQGFYGLFGEKDVYKQDWTYLNELNEWQKRADDVNSDNE
ncbi:hypothetical protein P692DRAFT_20878594 [Suillus brevipes Sb2]|nr:hypothetical protein P692DRAFT_20878594 [Suillus brevipes Sb2]